MKKLIIISICWLLSGCAALQSKSDQLTEKAAQNENLELETSVFFDKNSTDYIVKSILKFSFGKQEYWGTIGRLSDTLLFNVNNYHWSFIRNKGFFNPFKKTRTRSYGFEIPNTDGSIVSCECNNYAYRKNFFFFKKYEEYLDCDFNYNNQVYQMSLSKIPTLEELFPIFGGNIDDSYLSIIESHNIKGSNQQGKLFNFFGRQGYKFYKNQINKEVIVVDPYKIRLLNSTDLKNIPLHLAMALSVRQYQNLTNNWE